MNPNLAALLTELRGRPRLALLVVVALLVLIVEAGLRVRDARVTLAEENSRLASQVARLEQFEAPDTWRERFEGLEALNGATERRLWHAETSGLGRAELTRYVERMSAQARWEEPRIDIAQPLPVEGVPDLWRIEGRVAGFADPLAVIRFLNIARRDARFFHIIQLQIAHPAGRRGQGNISFAVFLRTGATA
ncbi:MAG: hypothetical protein AAGE01_01365 [Pseudomonadota bacterium]